MEGNLKTACQAKQLLKILFLNKRKSKKNEYMKACRNLDQLKCDVYNVDSGLLPKLS